MTRRRQVRDGIMSSDDYRPFVKPEEAPRIGKVGARVSLENYPPFLENLLGMWARLAAEPFIGITSDGQVRPELFELRPNGAHTAAAAAAATRWLHSLPPRQRAIAQRRIDAPEWRHWHNTPLVLAELPEFDQLRHAQRSGALEVVRQSLSADGFRRVAAVIENNELLGKLVELEGLLNRDAFTLTIFGSPSTSEPWGWQLFGHHLALNAVFLGEQMVMAPVFLGVEPDTPDPETGRRLFQPHEEAALAFRRSLAGPERDRAVLHGSMLTGDQPPGRFHPDDGRQLGGAFQDNRVVPYEGLPVAGLSVAQRHKLLALAELFVSNLAIGPAEASLREIEKHLSETHFAWIGPADETSPFYFRIHGPVALIEFDHHSGIFLANREPARFHVHTIVRAPNGGDYGKDLLHQHYARSDHRRNHHDGFEPHSHDGGETFHRHD